MNSTAPETEVADDATACLALTAQARFERFKRAAPRLAIAELELMEIERRLGTAEERPHDVNDAVALGHEIRNILCICMLRSACA